jgi:hypothetical protein
MANADLGSGSGASRGRNLRRAFAQSSHHLCKQRSTLYGGRYSAKETVGYRHSWEQHQRQRQRHRREQRQQGRQP